GSGSEIVLCKELGRNFISCEIHPQYYKMIQERLLNNGKIPAEYRLKSMQERSKMNNPAHLLELFDK
ncbi:MAG: site-specific DNA-methyltransferase, partial [Bacteroidia bacterium]|nr:site-specific DNA-methyltransferase [Bacteroidia bacterium]